MCMHMPQFCDVHVHCDAHRSHQHVYAPSYVVKQLLLVEFPDVDGSCALLIRVAITRIISVEIGLDLLCQPAVIK